MNASSHLIFGTGPVGLAILRALQTRGITPTMVNRSGRIDIPGVPVIACDVTDTSRTAQIAQGAACIYNATNPPYEQWETLFPPLNTSILRAAQQAGARLIVMDNLYMYGPSQTNPMRQDMPYRPVGKKSVTRARMATELLDAHQRGDVRVVIGRASDFFGPGVLASSVGERLFYPAVQGKAAQLLFDIDLPHTYSYVPDIGEGLVRLAEADDAYGQAWHLPAPRTVTTREFTRMVFEAAGHPMRVQVIGHRMSRLLGIFVPILREMQEMAFSGTNAYVMDDTPFRERFGDIATPLERAIAETVAWFRAHPAA